MDTNQVMYPTGEGYYSVSITGQDGCSSFSNAIYWTLGLTENQAAEIKVYPNPTNSHLTIESAGNIVETIRITTIESKLVYEETVNDKFHQVDVSYFLRGPIY